MKQLPHFIWATEIVDKIKHFSECKERSEPFICLSRKEKDYVLITLDTLPMYDMCDPELESASWPALNGDCDGQGSQEELEKPLSSFYGCYCRLFGMPEDKTLFSGTEDAFALLVHQDHAYFVAEGLYHYLVKCRNDFRALVQAAKA